MSSLRLQRMLLERINRTPSSFSSPAARHISTTTSRYALPSTKPSPSKPSNSANLLHSKATRTVRLTAPSRRSASQSQEQERRSPDQEAIRAAEAKEAALREARLRRANESKKVILEREQKDRPLEEAKAKEEKQDYLKRYNTAAGKWTRAMIALPIFFVTSYYLFDRLVLGHEPKQIPKVKEEE